MDLLQHFAPESLRFDLEAGVARTFAECYRLADDVMSVSGIYTSGSGNFLRETVDDGAAVPRGSELQECLGQVANIAFKYYLSTEALIKPDLLPAQRKSIEFYVESRVREMRQIVGAPQVFGIQRRIGATRGSVRVLVPWLEGRVARFAIPNFPS